MDNFNAVIQCYFQEHTIHFYKKMFWGFLLTYMAPILAYILVTDKQSGGTPCLIVATISVLIFLAIDIMMNVRFYGEWIDNARWMIILTHLGLIISDFHCPKTLSVIHKQIDDNGELTGLEHNEFNWAVARVWFYTLNLYMAWTKMQDYLRFQDSYGKLIALFYRCQDDIKVFFSLFCGILIVFSLWNYILENEMILEGEADDGTKELSTKYPHVFLFMTYLINQWRNSVGDIVDPEYDVWLSIAFDGSGEGTHNHGKYYGYAYTVISLIWIVWLLSMLFNLIVLLNFLIAIVNQSYEEINMEQVKIKYTQ